MDANTSDISVQQEIEDILLFHLFKGDEKYNYEDVTYMLSQYGLDLNKDQLKKICSKLGDERKLNWKETPDRIEAKLLPAGHAYVDEKIHPLSVNQQKVQFEKLYELLKDLGRSDDFELLDEHNKEGLSINFTPNGKFSENYFRIIRMKFLYYAVYSSPKVEIKSRKDFESVIDAFRQWLGSLSEKSTSTNTAQLTDDDRPPLAFVVGGYLSGDDQVQRFLSEGIWENEKDNEDDTILKTVQVGDTFVLKSTFSIDRSSILRIKGVGKVMARKSPGIFAIDWTIKDISLDVENLGFYRKTIEQIKQDDWRLIEDHLRHYFAKNSNVRLQYDSVSDIDLLGRRPFAKAIGDYVSRLWEDYEESAYAIHLSGEWGSGKSNVLKFLAEDLDSRHWMVLHYNAWEHQHIESPWWMFSNKVYKQILGQLRWSWLQKGRFWFKEFWWRLFVINKLSWISFLFIGALAIFFLKLTLAASDDEVNWLSLIGTILTTGGSLWLLFKGISGSLLPGSDESAQNFQRNINDPIDLVKTHFESMIKFPKRDVAIFIDDIDRCSSKNVVKLLEGVQTIFKSTKVLYVFAGDAGWVRRCFEIEYQGFSEGFKKPGHTLGNFFVEKVFQMSVNIPVITQENLKSFLRQTLNPTTKLVGSKNTVKLINKDFENVKSEMDIERVLKKYRGSDNEERAIEIAIDRLSSNETLNDLEHELEAYCSLLPVNVRSIKRFINSYAIARQTLLLQRVSFTDVPMDALVRWLILSSQYPLLAEELTKCPSLLNKATGTPFATIISSVEFQKLVKDHLNEKGIRLIVGK